MTTTLTKEAPASSEPVKKKKKKKAGAEATPVKVKVKKDKAAKAGKVGKKAGKSAKSDGFEGLAKLVEHPLVADLLAAGAIAAVAAIAEHQLDKDKGKSSSKMVKSAGKAAAAAMGRKLMGDIGKVTTAATEAAADAAKKA